MSEKIIDLYVTDGVKLNGYLMKGEKKTENVLIEIHGMTSNCFKKREREIAKNVNKIGVDAICINTRGSEIVKYIKKDGKKELAGTAFENVEESYYDILGAIKYAISLGYSSIYIQGHSLGSTKTVYTYNKMKQNCDKEIQNIKGILLLSLVDIPDLIRTYTDKKYLQYAEDKERQGDIMHFMPEDAFINPISVKTYLRYAKYNKDIDFAQYSKKDYKFNELNNINVPLFMRWGSDNELIRKSAKEQVELMEKSIKNKNKDIGYIEGADHSYTNKEKILANEIVNFLKKS